MREPVAKGFSQPFGRINKADIWFALFPHRPYSTSRMDRRRRLEGMQRKARPKKLNGEKGNGQPLHSRAGVPAKSAESQVRLVESGRNGFAHTFGRNQQTFG